MKKNSICHVKVGHRNSVFLLFVVSFTCLLFISTPGFSQKSKLGIATVPPEWNNKTFCDNGNGFDPSPITAPGFSYVGSVANDPKYNYAWEQKAGDGNWEEVSSGKQKVVIPAFNPSLIKNKNKQGEMEKFQWRLKVTDVANGNQTVTSEVYSLQLAAKLNFTYTTTADAQGANAVEVLPSGGIGTKRYTWSSADAAIPFPADRMHNKNQEGLQAGVYKLTITDEGCKPISQTITIIKK
ncbi:MAG: hypothetical protein IPI46_01235 [Bacteroidetes bacterium]|nr:hypothetical protein [Bacteroidota bacterium]